MSEQILEIPLTQITSHPDNRRVGGFDQEKLEQLAGSIRAVGVQQPAVVRQAGANGRYEIVAGERRFRAAGIAGLEALPCVVRDLDDISVLKIQTIENMQREDVHPLDEAEGYHRLIEKAGYDVEVLAEEVGKSISYVYQRLKLRELMPAAAEAMIEGKITAGHGILIARLQPGQQKEALEYCAPDWRDQVPAVRDLDEWIHSNILMLLSKASFKKDDAELLAEAGPCTTCEKRTGYIPALFPEIKDSDHCTDPDCFNGKLDALVWLRREALKMGGEKFLEISDGYSSNLPKGVLPSYEWEECRKKDEGAQRCLVVAGPARGRLTWGKKSDRYHYEPTPKEKEAQRKEKEEGRIRSHVQGRIWDETIDKIRADLSDNEPSADVLRLIVGRFFDRLYEEDQRLLCKLEKWERPPKENYENAWDRPGWSAVVNERIGDLDSSELYLLLVKCALIENIKIDHWNYQEEKDELRITASSLGIDLKKIEEEIRKGEPRNPSVASGSPDLAKR